MAITLYKNDYGTPLIFNARTKDKAVPLVASKVIFTFTSKATNQRVGGGDCEVLDVAAGKVKYTFKEGELAQEGEFQGKITVELAQGARRDGVAMDFTIVDPAKIGKAPA
jgi:hypothetical protein